MANVRVAVRVRPLSKRETKEGGRIIVEVDGKVAKIRNLKVDSRLDNFGDSREKIVAFGFDYCYWSVNPEDPQYASQDVVFQDLGTEVLSGAAEGYNICLFAYGQTGSGKTYTMLGTPASVGLTPRICEGLFLREEDCASLPSSCRITVSFLEIYNERVRDLLKQSDPKKSYILRVREHPETGPYVQGLSQHSVTNYEQVIQLLEEGLANRITAATHVHEASSRSHAIFTIHYTQALLENSLPLEIASKINLVDLAGSERADPSYCKDRIAEGANINKSLVTLGIVISTLAQNSQVFSSCQNISSAANSGDDSGIPSSASGTSSGGAPSRRQSYIPYRDSVLTWLLKDSLGGNSKTIMVATVSPAHTSYSETMSTLRYAASAKNIINAPRVNEDANVKLIRELRLEIKRLKAMLLSLDLRNFRLLNDKMDEKLKEIVLQNELKIGELTKDWTQKWNDWQALLDHYSVDVHKRRAGVVIDSSLPHLMALEDDVLSTGVVLYHLKEGTTKIGRIDSDQEQDIVLQGQWIERDHCTITRSRGVVVLQPTHGARCTVNGREVTASCRLTQGAVITLGKAQRFRFNHPAEAALLRRRRQVGEAVAHSGSLEWLDLDGDVTASRLGLCPVLWKERRVLEEQCDKDHQLSRDGETSHRAQNQQQQCYVEDLKQILEGQIRAQKELELNEVDIGQQIKDNQKWLLQEKTWLTSLPQQQQLTDRGKEKELEASVAPDAWLQTDPETPASPLVQSQKRAGRLQFLGRHAVRRKKVSFQLDRLIKKRRLLETRRRLEQLRTLCWPQDDSVSKPPCRTPSANATVPGPQHRSRWTSCSFLSLQRLCRQYLPQLHRVPMELLKLEDLQGKQDLAELENSNCDNSQVSKDSLAHKGRPRDDLLVNDHGQSRSRAVASVRGFPSLSYSGLRAQALRSFSLDSLLDAEEEPGGLEEEPALRSAAEMPAETFWHLHNATLPAAGQEAAREPAPLSHRTGASRHAILPMGNSFSLVAQFQPHCEQPESEGEANSSDRARSLQGMQPARESPLASVDSWFSCDSKIDPGSPSEIVGSFCPSPEIQEVEPCGEERPWYWINIEEIKPSGMETILSYSPKLPRGSAKLPCSVGTGYIPSAVAEDMFQGRRIPDTTQQGTPENSHNSSTPSMLAASASSFTQFTHRGSSLDRDWDALQRKYLLELSHSASEAAGEPPILQANSSSLAEASNNIDTQLPEAPGVTGNLDFNYFPVYLSKMRRLRAKGEQEDLKARLESAADFPSTSEKKVSCSGAYSTNLESLASGSTNAHVCAAGNKMPSPMAEACEVKQNSVEESFQGSRKYGLMTSSSEYFFQKACDNNVTITTKDNPWPQDQAPLRKSTAVQPGQLSPNSHHPLQEKTTDWQDSSEKEAEKPAGVSFALHLGPELYLHAAPWNPLPSCLQPPPLETFYVTKSRDALTETALEIPACREVRVPSPPPREAWGFGHNCQVLEKAYLKNQWPVISQNLNSKISSSQLVVAKRPADLNTRVAIKESEKCPGNMKEEKHDSAYCFVAQNRHQFPSTSIKACEFENQVILNKKPGPPACKEEDEAATCDSISFDSSGSGKTLLFICGCASGGEEEQGQSAVVPQNQACSIDTQLSSGARSDFIYKTTHLGAQKDIPGTTAISFKSRSVCCQVSCPMITTLSESPTHKWEERHEARLPGKGLLLKDSTEVCMRPETESTCGRFPSVTCSQERNPSERKGCGRSQETINSKEEALGKKLSERVNNADEMARLIRSVVQLENGILEIESKQNQQLHASPIPGVSKEFVSQDLKDQERVDHILMPGSSGNHAFFKAQPSSPREMCDAVFRESEAWGMVGNGATDNDPQACKHAPSPFRSSDCAQESQSTRDSTHTVGTDHAARGTCVLSGKSMALRKSTNTSLHPRRRKTLARALPLHPRLERSSEDKELLQASTDCKEQPWDLGSLEELEIVKSCLESQTAEHVGSSASEDTQAQGRVEAMTMQRGQSPEEENNSLSLIKKLPSPGQRCKGAFFNQETVSLLMNQKDFSTATPYQEPSNALPVHFPRPPRSCVHASNTEDMSSVAHMLDSTALKIHSRPLATEVGHQDQSGETRSCNPQGNVRGASSMAHTARCGSVEPIAIGPDDRSVTAESIPLEARDRIAGSRSLQNQRGDLKITPRGLSTQESFVQEEIRASSLNRVSRQIEKKVSFLLEEHNDQGGETRQKAEEAEDQPPASSAALPRVPDCSVHASICLAILKEIRQAKAQGKPLNDSVPGGSVLPYYETSLEPEGFSEANGGPQWQMDPAVSDSAQNEHEARGLHASSVSCASECLLADEKNTQASPLCHLQAFSPTATDLDKTHCTGELRHFPGASEHFLHHSSSSEVIEKKKDRPRTLSCAGPLDLDMLLSSTAVEQGGRAGAERAVSTLSSQASYNDPSRILHGQSQLAAWETIEGASPGSGDSNPEHQEPKSLDSTHRRSSDNIPVVEQEGKTVHFEGQSVICDAHNSASLSGPKQEHVQCPEVSTDLEDRRAAWPGALRKVEPEAPAWQHVKWKNIRPGLTEACRTSSKSPRPTPLLDQRPSLGLSGVTEETPGQCPKEISSCFVFSGNSEGNRPLASSSEEEKNKPMPCSQLCSSRPTATNARSSHASTFICCKDGDLEKETSKATPLHVQSSFRVLSGACEMDEIRESSSKAPQVLLTHDLELKGVTVALAPIDNSSLEPSTAAAALSQGCSSLSIPARTRSITYSALGGSSASEGDPEEKTAEKRSSTDLDAVPFPTDMSSDEPLGTMKDGLLGQQARTSETKPLAAAQGPHALNLSKRSAEKELAVEARHGHLENPTPCLSEKTQPSPETRNYSYLNPLTKSVAKLTHICRPQADSFWEEEEQQRDWASAGGKDHVLVRSPLPFDEGGMVGCQMREDKTEERAVTKSPVSQVFCSDFENSAGQLYDRKHQAPQHGCSPPVITVSPGPKHSTSSPRPQFAAVSSSRSVQELNLSVEPPSPTHEDAQWPNRLSSPCLGDYSSGKSVSGTSPKIKDYRQKASSNLDSGLAEPVTPPYPTSSTISCMPTPNLMTNWMSGTLEQAHQGKPEKLCVQGRPEYGQSPVDKGMLHVGSRDVNTCDPPWCPPGPVHIGWKQYVFGSAVDVSSSQKPHGLLPLNGAQHSSIDSGLQDKNSSLLHPHLSAYAKNHNQSSTCSSIENAQSSSEAWEVWTSSFALGDPHVLTGPEGVAPTLGPANRSPFKSPADEAGCLRRELPLAVRSSAAPVDEIMLLHPTEAGCPRKQARMNTFEQGTQTLGCSLHWSCTDISAQPDAITMSACELASWTSMHNLSLHLSQILHSTSELLGSLSQPSVAAKEQSIKSDSPHEAPQALMMDGATQTTMDQGVQTDLPSPPLPLPAPEMKLREVSVILEVPNSSIITMSQEKRDVSGALLKRKAEETAWETAPQDLHEESTHCKLQNPPVPLFHLKTEKAPLGQSLPSVSPSTSDSSLPPGSLPRDSSTVVSSRSMPHSAGLVVSSSELTQEPPVQKSLGPTNAWLVDRASSPILTLSASTQELGSPLACLRLSAPSAHSLEGHQQLDTSSGQAVDASDSSKDNYSRGIDESDGSQRAEFLARESKSPLQRSAEKLSLESDSPCSPQQSPSLQVSCLGWLQPTTQPTTQLQSRLSPSPPRDRSQRLDDSIVPEKATYLEPGPLSSGGPSQWQARPASGVECPTFLVEPQAAVECSRSWRGLQPFSPCPVSEETHTAWPQGSALGPPQACQPLGLLCPSPQMCVAPGPQHHSLRDLPVHNKFNNWCGLQDGPPGGLCVSEELGPSSDPSAGDQGQRPPPPSDDHSQDLEWSQKEHIPLQVGVQSPSLSMELTEAKLHRGFGETDALLQMLQSETGEAGAAEEPAASAWEELHARQKKAIETLRRERAERLQNFRRTRSLSPQKQLSVLPDKDPPTWELDLPSRRQKYLQQLRKDVVESSRSPEPALRAAHQSSNIELILKDYQQAREEAKVEIAQARDRLRERTEQEKLRIRQQILSRLQREEEKLQTLAHSSSLCTSSNGSLSSGVTSGYNSNPALSGHLQCPEGLGDSQVPGSRDTWIGDWRGCSAVRSSQLYLEGPAWKSLSCSHSSSLGNDCCSPSSLSSLGTSSYKDLAKHIVDTSMADVMAACSDNLHNLFSRRATAGWSYQGEEQEVQLYYKEFSSTRHGFLGAGVVSQPLAHVWAAVSDPTLWPLYHKPIQTARLHQRVTNSISLVYLVCDTTLCALKQLRDFCCVCVEAKEGHLSIMAAQSVYDTSMPRPNRKMVRGEILPSAWVLQPVTMEGREVTRVIFLAQVELGAPGFPPHLLSSFIKQQPLVVAKLASFLGS